MKDNHTLVKKEEKPTLKLYLDLKKSEREIVDLFTSKFEMTEQEAIETLFIPEKYMEWKSLQQRTAEVKGIASLPQLFEAMEKKIQSESMGQVKEAWTAIGIALDKNFGQKGRGNTPIFQIGGEQVSIKINFPFQPYNKNNPIERLQEVRSLKGEDDN